MIRGPEADECFDIGYLTIRLDHCAAAIAFAREGTDVAINYFAAEEPDARDVIALAKAEGRTD